MGSFIAIKEKDGKRFKQSLPFNPTIEGWDYHSACCCNVSFTKGDLKMKVDKDKKIVFIEKEEKQIDLFSMPNNQIEFKIISSWL